MLAAAAALLAGACGVGVSAEESVADKDSLVIGVNSDQPGLSTPQGDHGYTGFDVDVARDIARRLGATVTFQPVSSRTREVLLQKGDVDLVVASYSITPERKTEVAFAGPYYVAKQDILVRESDAGAVKNVRDLAGKRLCRVSGSNSYPRVQEEKGVAVLPAAATGYDDCLRKLSGGSLDAVSTDDLILAGLAAKAAKSGSGGPPLRMVNAPFSDEPYGVGIARGDLDGCEAVNKAITEMYQDGTAARLLKTWFGPVGLNVATTVPQFEGCD
ncbi:transporter substrate-binding domain-containing protein [Actinomadura vinacea]|uniref:transporter substrate-binding domain-containing protein n=1 Tax=Actinomadura vinacea TaxID=115336 RepID=UPI0031E3F355